MDNQTKFDTLDIFVYLWKKRKPLIIVTILGAIVSVVVSLMLPNYFKATSVLFPTTFISPSTSTLHVNTNQETDPLLIGDEDDLEKMIQLLKSDFITNSIIQKYNLIEHYELSANDPHLNNKLHKTYEGNVTFNKTPYQGVIVSVVDIEPQLAADMANDIANLYDTLVFNMQKQRSEEIYEMAKNAYEKEEAYIQMLEDSLDVFRQYGILDYYKESERYSEAYGKAIGNNKLTAKGQAFFDKKFALLRKYGKKFQSIASQINDVRKNLTTLHLNLIQAEQNLKFPTTHKYVISYAQVPDKKAFPKRSIIVILSTMGAFVFSIVLLLLFDFFNELKKRLKEIK